MKTFTLQVCCHCEKEAYKLQSYSYRGVRGVVFFLSAVDSEEARALGFRKEDRKRDRQSITKSTMAIRVVEFSSGGYKIRKIYA